MDSEIWRYRGAGANLAGVKPASNVRQAFQPDFRIGAAYVRLSSLTSATYVSLSSLTLLPRVSLSLERLTYVGRVAIAWRMTPTMRSRSAPTSGSRGGRTVSAPKPHSAIANLMYCTSFGCVSRWSRGVYQR